MMRRMLKLYEMTVQKFVFNLDTNSVVTKAKLGRTNFFYHFKWNSHIVSGVQQPCNYEASKSKKIRRMLKLYKMTVQKFAFNLNSNSFVTKAKLGKTIFCYHFKWNSHTVSGVLQPCDDEAGKSKMMRRMLKLYEMTVQKVAFYHKGSSKGQSSNRKLWLGCQLRTTFQALCLH